MKVKIKTSLAGLDFSYVEGDEPDLPDAIAQQWVSAGVAELLVEEKKTSEDSSEESEKQVKRKKKVE